MPRGNSARQESKEIQKAIDKEQKRNRGAISCAECRRLKLKCDKTVPCSSCKRRGCSAICPNGSLATGQGTRFVLADTETLHQKISQLSDRIRQLEDALAILQSIVSPGEQHPLLNRDLVAVKSIIDLHAATDGDKVSKGGKTAAEDSDYIQPFGTLALRDDGTATFYGPSAGHEGLLIGERTEHSPPPLQEQSSRDLPEPVKRLSHSFPLALTFDCVVDLDYLVQNHLPPWKRAHQLCEIYLSRIAWLMSAVPKRQLLEVCLPMWYDEAADLFPSTSATTTTDPANPASESSNKNPHELALFFIVLCIGALYDDALPYGPDNEEAKVYFELTKAALNLEPVMESAPSVSTVQTLTVVCMYYGMCGGDNSIECAWNTLSIAAKLAQSIGLHRDCSRWQLPSFEVQKRRAVFWELLFLDSLQSLATGRLATFHQAYVDCELPDDPDSTLDEDGTVIPGFTAWKARFAYECIAPVAQNMQTAKAPRYSVIIELDRRVRDMEMPKYPPHALHAAMATNFRCLILLYIHRCFFAEAVSNHPANPMSSPFAPSFLAGYRNSCEILGTLRSQFDLFPAQIARLWALWAHAFSSAVMLSSVVTYATGKGSHSKVTSVALAELRRAVDLFERASTHGGRAGKFLPILQRLLQKAEHAYKTCKPALTRKKDIFTPSAHNESKDELSIFSGQLHRVSMRGRIQTSSSQASSCRPAGAAVTGTDPTSCVGSSGPEIADFPGLHPSLRDQWADFDMHLNNQILDAQREDYYPEPDVEMLHAGRAPEMISAEGRLQQTTLPQVSGETQHPDPAAQVDSTVGPRTWCDESCGATYPGPGLSGHHFTDEQAQFQYDDHHLTASSRQDHFQPLQTSVLHYTTHPHQHQETRSSHDSYTTPIFSPSHEPLGPSVGHVRSSQQHWDTLQHWDQQPFVPAPHTSFVQSAPIDHPADFAPYDLQETWQSFRIYVGSPAQSPFM